MLGMSQFIISQTMNLKIDRVLPYPPTTLQPYLLAVVYLPQPALLLYASPPPPEKTQQPKKKFAFKAPTAPTNTVENVYLFDIASAQWRVQQTKGKFPTRRQNAAAAYMGPCLMVYGGTQITPSKQLNDLYGLNLTTWQWKKLFTMQGPPVSSPNLAVSLSQDKLAIVSKNIWIFQAKEVIWSNQSTDLPGGIWKKVKDIDMPIQPRCLHLHQNQIVVFGFGKGFEAFSINTQKEELSQLTIEGQLQGKGDKISVIRNTENNGFLVDGSLFGSFFILNQTLFIGDWIQSTEVMFDSLVSVQTPEMRINYGINSKKELNSVIIQMPYPQAEEEELPNTARQITTVQVEHHFSSQKQEFNDDEVLHSPPFNPQSQPAILTQNLSALLAQEWLRRRVLQEKARLLQDSIKKAERMVLALCRYGDEQQKRNHISKVCKIRESLYRIFQSQNLILQKMAENPALSQLRERAIKTVHGPINPFEFNDQ